MRSESHTPHTVERVLYILGGPVLETLRSHNLQAAERWVRTAIAEVNNEAAWTYDSDSELGHMNAYLATLHDTLARIRQWERTYQSTAVRDVCNSIHTLLEEASFKYRGEPAHRAPDEVLSVDEVEHRQRVYGDPSKAAKALKVFD